MKLRILLLAPGCNPNILTGSLIAYSLGRALAELHTVTLVNMARHAEAVDRAGGGFHSQESIAPIWIDRVYDWVFQHVFKRNYGSILWSGLACPQSIFFEWRAWRRLQGRIRAGEFDVVLRILPIDPKAASPFSFFLRHGPIPFVIGPLSGGLPWPKGFPQLDRQLRGASFWASRVRRLYRLLPFSHSTFAQAAAIIAASSNTCRELVRFQDKLFFLPGENGVNPAWFQDRATSYSAEPVPLRIVMVNRLVPLKAVDIGIRGAAPLVREGRARLVILGDGPERQRLNVLVDEIGVRHGVTFFGEVQHADVLARLRDSDVLLFPSLREFGGGVVFEALALGAVPVVADYGGPGDIVTNEVGLRIPLTEEHRMAADIESVLRHLASDRTHLEKLRCQGAAYARSCLTWEAKARMVTQVLLWAVSAGPKPSMPPPSGLSDSTAGRS